MKKQKKKQGKKKKNMLQKTYKNVSGFYILAGIIFFVGIVLLVIFQYTSPSEESSPDSGGVFFGFGELSEEKTEDKGACEFFRALDGVCVESEDDIDPSLVGIMIENHYDARPLSGLGLASVVYEAPVEGNFNRFLAIYPVDADVEKAGPVRSARPYYLDWVSEYPGMMYMHVGGSNDALAKIKTYDLSDINEMYRGWYFWRSKDRYAPHNTYTSQELWNKAIEDYGETGNGKLESGHNSWKFERWDACAEDCVEEITTTYSGQTYEATWKYNTTTQQYNRYEFDEPVIDRETDDQIVADTLIIQYVDTTVLDGVGRLGMDTIGTGDAIVFRNGFSIEGEWQKDSRTDRTKFYDVNEEGQEIEFKPGKIWIAVMNRVDGVVFGNE